MAAKESFSTIEIIIFSLFSSSGSNSNSSSNSLSHRFIDHQGNQSDYFSELEFLFGRLKSQNKESVIMGDINCVLNTPLDNNTKRLNNIINSFGAIANS